MQTLQELYEEVKKSEDLRRALAEAVKAGKGTDFLKANGCEAATDELKEFVAEKAAKDKPIELNEDELEMVVGGLSESDEANLDFLKFFCDLFSLLSMNRSNNVSD